MVFDVFITEVTLGIANYIYIIIINYYQNLFKVLFLV